MAPSVPATEKSLRTLQQLVRRGPSGSEVRVMTRMLPPELTGGETKYIDVLPDEVAAAEAATTAPFADLRFEHLEQAADEVWHFVAE